MPNRINSEGRWYTDSDPRYRANGLISSHTEEPKSKYELANTEDHGYVSGVRASTADRNKVVSHLRQAHNDGRLTADEFHARSEAAVKAITQKELVGIARDLPEPKAREHNLTRAADALEELEREHTHLFHGGILVGLTGMMLAGSIPFMLWGTAVGNSPWCILPVLTYIIGLMAMVVNAVVWVDNA